jgi:hypothetical protein
LRQSGQIKDYLEYFPEHTEKLAHFREQIHKFTKVLYLSYSSCFIYKNTVIDEYPPTFQSHMKKLHYEEYLVPKRSIVNANINTDTNTNTNTNTNVSGNAHIIVTFSSVVKYVNRLHPSFLLNSLTKTFKFA